MLIAALYPAIFPLLFWAAFDVEIRLAETQVLVADVPTALRLAVVAGLSALPLSLWLLPSVFRSLLDFIDKMGANSSSETWLIAVAVMSFSLTVAVSVLSQLFVLDTELMSASLHTPVYALFTTMLFCWIFPFFGKIAGVFFVLCLSWPLILDMYANLSMLFFFLSVVALFSLQIIAYYGRINGQIYIISSFFIFFITMGAISAYSEPHPASPIKRLFPAIDTADVVLLCVLPVCNAVFDFLSIGVTRYALRRALRVPSWTWGIAALDLVAAALLFVGLKVAVVVVVLGLNTVAGGGPAAGVVELQALLDDIDCDEHAYWWLYLGFLTTLLPTFAHFFVGLWSVGGWLPRRAGAWLAGRAPYFSEDAIEAFWLWFGVTSYATATIALPAFAGWYAWQGIVWTYPQAGGALLDLARWLLATATALHGPA